YDIRYLNGGDSKSATIWSLLSRNGKKVGVVNVPMTYPAKEVNGFLISGMDAPGRGSSGFTYPGVLAEELFRIVPDYVIEPGITTFVSRKQYDLAIEMAMNSIDARGRATRYLMDKYLWEFFMVVFRESDVIQHHFWKFAQEGEYALDNKYSDTILNIYKRLDFEVGRMISKLAEDCYVIVLSDHGCGSAEGGPPYLNHLLRHLGMLEFKEGGDKLKGRFEGVRQRFLEKTVSFLHRHTSRKSKEKMLRLFPGFRDRLESERYFSNIDWAKTRAFSESSRIELWINLKGREPLGVVLPGREYEDLCEEIRKRLYQWHDPLTSKRVVKKVFRKEEVYHGKYLDRAPDLLIIFEDDIKISGIMLVNKNGNREYVNVPQNVSDTLKVNGAHRDNGLFIMKGYGIKRGVELECAEIVDLAPTITLSHGRGNSVGYGWQGSNECL
ncbi:MAG: alkaline phosphatase family protein, partial [Candidatus Omnitrophica bacterium]|nr:alkaline phosphatase family protein [Candidatus Omnitrophota bacterium]